MRLKKVHGFLALNRRLSLAIHKSTDGEYRVRLYTQSGRYVELSGEYFTDDLRDARATAAAQLRWARKQPGVAKFLVVAS